MALLLCGFGHVATTAELLAHVDGQDSIVDIYQRSKYIVRVRRGLYACAHLPGVELAALRAGGILDCVSALRAAGVALPDDGRLHVRFHAEGSRARPRPELAAAPVVAHWGTVRYERRSAEDNLLAHRYRRRPVMTRSRLRPEEAFRQALLCTEGDGLRALIDAVVGTVLPADEVRSIVSESPRRTRELLMRVGGR